MKIEMFFAEHPYAIRPYNELDESLECYAYPGALSDRWVAGVSIRIDSALRDPWVGHFLSGRESPRSTSVCCDHPDGVHAVIVAGGVAYQISPVNPEEWAELPIRPVMGLCPSISAKALALFDYSRILVLYADGRHWITGALSWDGLKNLREVDGVILGEGWDATTGRDLPFEVDLASRNIVGGASPPTV
ncbi:hypothetical protein [Rhizobacter sp. LjRoot28]|uniref:hypothetical protein n=1 Tax=Rhizobacter sp. LjRoot28 TaxID=3342309 RepID=UPI003ECF536F